MDEQERYVLLRIKRMWSKDESVAALLKQVSELQTEIGIQKSEIAELKFKLQKKCPPPPEPEVFKTLKKWKKSEAMNLIMQEMIEKDIEINRLTDQVRKYADTILQLKAVYNKP
jgi:hypothetical protein